MENRFSSTYKGVFSMPLPSVETLRTLWNAGLGQAYRTTRNGFSMSLCSDSPSIRRFFYGVIVACMALATATCFVAAYAVNEIVLLSLLCVLVSGLCAYTAYDFLKAYKALTRAQSFGEDTDLNDPMRVRAFQRAYTWGLKRGKIVKDAAGTETFIA